MTLNAVVEFLDGAPLGIFGAGHLGRAMATALLAAGLPRRQLLICHGGSAETAAAIAAQGLGDCAVTPALLLAKAKLVFYLVRPQAAAAIGGFAMRPDARLVSFLAGTGLAQIPAALPLAARLRAMVSDPDTLAKRDGIAALFPGDAVVEAALAALGLRVLVLPREADFAAFTALGPCLPIAAAYWLGMGSEIAREPLLALGARHGFAFYEAIVDWALKVCPKNMTRQELDAYITHAATPGGVTEAVLGGYRDGIGLAASLERGIVRCEELSKG